MARTNRRIYATRRKRSPIQMGGIGRNFMEQNPNFRDVLGGGALGNMSSLVGSGTPTQNSNVVGGVAGGSFNINDMFGTGMRPSRRPRGRGMFGISLDNLGGFKQETDVVGTETDPGSGSDRPAGMFSRVRARARRRMSELFETKTSVPPYLDDSSGSRGYNWKDSGTVGFARASHTH